jgi:hypothetical protein
MGMLIRTPISPATERRIRREGRSAAMRERALALRVSGWTYAAIGQALGVSTTRALQLVRRAEREIHAIKKGAPATGRLPHSDDPLAAGRTEVGTCTVYDPQPT